MASPLTTAYMADDFTLSLQDAVKILGKSERTIQRYLRKGRLAKQYITTERGQEIRLRESEVRQLADNLTTNGVTPPDRGDDNGVTLGGMPLKEFFSRYELAIGRIGYLQGVLEAKDQEVKLLTGRSQEMLNQARVSEEKATRLAGEKHQLEDEHRKLHQEKSQVELRAKELAEALQQEKQTLSHEEQRYQRQLQRWRTAATIVILLFLFVVAALAASQPMPEILKTWLGQP